MHIYIYNYLYGIKQLVCKGCDSVLAKTRFSQSVTLTLMVSGQLYPGYLQLSVIKLSYREILSTGV